MQQQIRTRKIVTIGMLAALAFAAVAIGRIPLVLFLKYDPKDIVIVIAGFLFGPLYSLLISLIVSFVEMITISDTGIIGFTMNVIATVAFACTAAYIYKKNKNAQGAFLGLIAGWVMMIAVMLLWNYILTPIFMLIPREDVVKLLWSAILPFNVIKGGLNVAATLLLYKPVVNMLRQAHLIPESPSHDHQKGKLKISLLLAALFILASSLLLILIVKGVI